jgi:hypothetical protein
MYGDAWSVNNRHVLAVTIPWDDGGIAGWHTDIVAVNCFVANGWQRFSQASKTYGEAKK